MNTAMKKALAICLSKRVRINSKDFFPVYSSENARKNLVLRLRKLGYLVPEEISGFFKMPPGAAELAVRDME